jgi:hypothetical protein
MAMSAICRLKYSGASSAQLKSEILDKNSNRYFDDNAIAPYD